MNIDAAIIMYILSTVNVKLMINQTTSRNFRSGRGLKGAVGRV
jgi:hypothetical protein